jgi:hypothetical protein
MEWEWAEIIVSGGALVAIVLFGDNIARHLRLYRGSSIWMKIFIIYIETIKAVGGTFLTLLWVATSLFLYEGIIEFFGVGNKGIIVAVFLVIPICLVFYGLLQGFVRLMDAFPEMLHHNNSDED